MWPWRGRSDRDFGDEIEANIALDVDRFMAEGMSADDARAAARRAFGNVTRAQERFYESRRVMWLDDFQRDVRYALRTLRQSPGFTAAAVTMLALAIGLNVTVFTIMDANLFRGFPRVKRNSRLVYMRNRYPSGAEGISYLDFEDWRAQAHAFEAMAFVGEKSIALRDGDGRPLDTQTWTVSANTFRLLGVSPMLGRDFGPADEAVGAPPVAILSYPFWKSRFGQRAAVVGSTVHINGQPATVIGVMPDRFDFPLPLDLWMPEAHTPDLLQRGIATASQAFTVVGRLRDGASAREAYAELETINRRLEATYPATNRSLVPTMGTHSTMMSGDDARIIWGALWAGACFVLLIASANLANLTLVRTMGRWREFSTRIALGAGQARMIRQILVENVILAGVGGTLGWWIANWSIHTWEAITASHFQVLDYTVNSSTLAYLVAISVAAAIVCSLAPIGRVVLLGVSGGLKGDARGVTQALRGKRLAAGLVAGQMALAIVLLSGAGVLMRSFLTIVNAETGIRDPEHVLVGAMGLPSDKYPNAETRLAYFDRLDRHLQSVSTIEAASTASTIPVRGLNLRTFEIEGTPSRPDGGQSARFMMVGSGYFRVMGAAAISGRDFNDRDHLTAAPVVMVNQSFAATFWPGEQPLDKRVRTLDRNTPGLWRTVVGVAPNIMQGDPLRQQFKPLVYMPIRQVPPARAYFFARTAGPPDHIARAVRAEVQQVDPDVTLEEFTTLKARLAFDRDYMDAEHSELGKNAKVAPIFALIALLLAAIGLSAVLAHSVTQRTKEIGVRMAIGATAKDIRRMVLREGLLPVAIGMILGLAASLAVNRILQSQLVGVSPYDPATMAGATGVLLVVALLACQIPARRATKVDPMIALRCD